jgi:hypothetical protein
MTTKTSFFTEIAEAIIVAWRAEWKMGKLIVRIAPPAVVSLEGRAKWAADLFGVQYIKFDQPCRAFVREKYPPLNDMLWDGRNNALCIAWLVRKFGGRAPKTIAATVKARDVDRRHDWNTCK